MSKAEIFQTAGTWKYLVICPSQGITKDLQQSFGGLMPGAELLEIPVYPPAAGLLEVITVQNPDVCLADIVSDRDRGLNLIKELAGMAPKIPVIAMIPGNDTDLILRCLRAGAAEFLLHPLVSDQIEEVLGRLVAKNPLIKGTGKAGRVVAIVPAKGACGASTVASGLTFHWKKKSGKTLLADLDPLTGTLSFLLKLKSQYSFMDVVTLTQSLDSDLWRNLIATTQGVDVLLSPEGAVDGVHDLMDASSIIDYARWHYETTILDCCSPYGPWNLSILRLADEILLVSTNELPSLQATQRALNYMDQNRIDRGKVKLVVNRYNRDVGLSKEVIETAIRCEVFQVLPSDFEGVQRAMIEGKPSPTTSPFGKGLAQLAEKMGGNATELPKATKSSSSWGGLLNLFSRSSS
jgi:pilus assembly protein CpaE